MGDERLGNYRLLRLLASGGMGEVFFARHEGPAGFAKPAVVKRILPHLAAEKTFVKMFLNEARLAALLQHTNVVQIFELGEVAGTYFIAMEYVHGRTLRAVHRKLRDSGRQFPPAELARIVSQALAGLHYAHSLKNEAGEPLQIIHRDMSPDNIIVGFDGAVKVLDFGIAKAVSAASITDAGTVKGKSPYMSPEHLRNEALDARSDLWAVGVLLFEMLAGERPFSSPSLMVLVEQVLAQPAPDLRQLAPQAPDRLCSIVYRALEKDRDRRYASAEDFASALEHFAATNGARLTNADTRDFMRSVYDAEADQNPGLLTPTSLADSVLATGPWSSITEAATRLDRPGLARRWPLVLAGALAVFLFAAGVGAVVGTPGASEAAVEVPDAGGVAVAVTPPPAEKAAPVPEVAEPAPPPPVIEAAPRPRAVEGHGKLDLRVIPWAEVFEGKRKLGITPMGLVELSAGAHALTLRNEELNISRNVVARVRANATTTLRVDLREP
jgi:serine/threonine protein kinase